MTHLARRTAALWVLILGAWGGIVTYVGPWFGYRFGTDAGWHWTAAQWELHLAPAVGAIIGAVLLMSRVRSSVRLGGYLALMAGAWFVVGPLFASMWLGPVETRVASASLHQVAGPLGYHYGTGLVIVALAAYAVGRGLPALIAEAYPSRGLHRRRAVATDAQAPAATAPVVTE